MNTKHNAVGRWYGILSTFIPKEHLTGKHTSCPLCSGKDRFRWDDSNGNGSYICNSCGAGTGIHLLAQHQGLSHAEAWKLVEGIISTVKIVKHEEKEYDRKKAINNILGSVKQDCSFVSEYLASRGITNAPESLQSGFYWIDGSRCQCMIARAAIGSKLAGLHVTFIRDGVKIGRRMYAVEKNSMVGSAIRLHRLNGGDTIVIGEGIETVLSYSQMVNIPAWAAMDAGKLESVHIPDQIKKVIICADKDSSFTGQAAAFTLAKRLKLAGKIVEVVMPENFDEDFNDQIRKDRP